MKGILQSRFARSAGIGSSLVLVGVFSGGVSTSATASAGVLQASDSEVVLRSPLRHPADERIIEPALGDDYLLGEQGDLGAGGVELPTGVSEAVVMNGSSGASLRIDMPRSGGFEYTPRVSDGVATYRAGSTSNIVIPGEQGIQMLTSIDDSSAPTRYDYRVSLGKDETLKLMGEGAAVVAANGEVRVVVPQPWAQDAAGKLISTHFEVKGDVLTQVVDHQVSGVAYPVVADPIWLAPWVVKCLTGLGLSSVQIQKIASLGSPGALGAAFGRAVVACVFGR